MVKIKFGTDGWRAIIAKEYTVDNVMRVADATARWMLSKDMEAAVIGYDCRFAGAMFARATAEVLGAYGLRVYLADHFASTPMVSYGVTQLKADMGIVITASHNPPDYNGYKLKSSYGGPTIPAHINEVEEMIPDAAPGLLLPVKDMETKGLLKWVDLEEMYIEKIKNQFDLDLILNSGIRIAYDAMFGAGQNVIKRLLPDAYLMHCDNNPSFLGTPPEPIEKNLIELADVVAKDATIGMGLATDGDADRIGLFDEFGRFVDSHRILLLLVHYLHHYKNMNGGVIITFSVTEKVKKLADHYGLPCEITKIGFKYISEIMLVKDVLVAGEESGGIAIKGHIPERDGIWMGLVILEFMAKTGKSLSQLIDEIYEIIGAFEFGRNDLHLTEAKKQDILKKLDQKVFKNFGKYAITDFEDLDGYKYYFGADKWVMIRPSGTEPVLRVYAQGPDKMTVEQILSEVCAAITA